MEKQVESLKLETETLRSEVEILANELRVLSLTMQNGITEIRDIVASYIPDEPEHTELAVTLERLSVLSVYALGALTAVGAGIIVQMFTRTPTTTANGYLPYYPINLSTAY